MIAALAALLVLAAPAAAAGRCGDQAQRPWCNTALAPDDRAGLLLAALTRDEKIDLLAGDELTGVSGRAGSHTGTLNGVPRVGMPPVYFSDGPVGPRQGQATAMPSPMTLASTFSTDHAFRHATIIGDEVRKKGNDVVFAPAVNMMRTPLNGRTFEYFGEDPWLASRMAVGWTKGVQSEGIIGNVKHYAVNNQEGVGPQPPGSPLGAAVVGGRLTVDARLDERTLREIYLPQFEAAVKEGGVGSVMCSYNRVNGSYACENEHLLEDVLKEDWAFDGFVLTDYGAAKSTANSLNNGLDLDIWPAIAYRPELVNAALAGGQVTEPVIDEHVRRILRTLFAFGFFDREAYVDDDTRVDREAHHAAAAELEEAGMVLLENDGNLLPLDAGGIGKLAVIGPEAQTLRNGGGSSAINPYLTTNPRQGIEARLGADKVVFDDGSDAARAAAVAKEADAAVVVVGDLMTEGSDKQCMGLNCSQRDRIDRDALIERVAAAQARTVLVLQTGGPVLTPWRDKVPAILEAWYPGQNGGTAMARVLFGDAEPGGRLPATFPLREEDEPTAGDPEKYPGVAERVTYKEGVLMGYRWFDAKRLAVAYAFGHGLTYSTFDFRDLRVEPGADATVSVEGANTGARRATAVPQLSVGMPAPREDVVQPPWQLKGFERVTLDPGERRRVRLTLDERAFSYWDTAANGWRVARGCYRVGVGASSRDLPLQATIGRGQDCGGPLELPQSAKACTSRRNFLIRLPRRARTARVTYAGRRAKIIRGRRLRARIDLRGLPKGRLKVRVVGRTRSGRVVRQTRVYRLCAKVPTKSRRWPRRRRTS
ncbi:MAG TPA: glycoside hydrolase family 3 C-terminal domain-containing protein [Solirubrobacteraceae bacterium]|nr:glycoside hydrolase family 3 C-terminal domain-containing protein [Solirubrobacteraceae bacterium]